MWFTLDKFLEFDLIWLLYINLFDLLLLTCFTFCVWSVARVTVFRVKFLYFIFLLALVSIWGVYYSFDAFIFLLLMAEFLILLLFLITALSFNFINSTRTLPTTLFYWFYGLTLLLYIGVVPHTVNLFLQSHEIPNAELSKIQSIGKFIVINLQDWLHIKKICWMVRVFN